MCYSRWTDRSTHLRPAQPVSVPMPRLVHKETSSVATKLQSRDPHRKCGKVIWPCNTERNQRVGRTCASQHTSTCKEEKSKKEEANFRFYDLDIFTQRRQHISVISQCHGSDRSIFREMGLDPARPIKLSSDGPAARPGPSNI